MAKDVVYVVKDIPAYSQETIYGAYHSKAMALQHAALLADDDIVVRTMTIHKGLPRVITLYHATRERSLFEEDRSKRYERKMVIDNGTPMYGEDWVGVVVDAWGCDVPFDPPTIHAVSETSMEDAVAALAQAGLDYEIALTEELALLKPKGPGSQAYLAINRACKRVTKKRKLNIERGWE